jgi:pimeloyl-ACP methyl ester carboxylesterase
MVKLTIAIAAAALAVLQTPATSRLPVPGGELVYDVSGQGDTVVFLHGAFMDRGSWDAQVPAFAKRFRVVRYDLRPFGESNRLDKAYSVADDLLALLDHLKVARAHLIGHSFGGGAALDFALLHPERVATLTLVSAGPSGFAAPKEEQQAAGAIFAALKEGDDAVIRAWLKHPMWAASQSRPEVLKALETSTRKSLSAFKRSAPPFIPLSPPAVQRLGDVKAPSLIVIGDRDTPGNRQASELLAKQIPGATLKVVAGADHALPLGWSGEFNDAALAFIAGKASPETRKPGGAAPPGS